MSRDQLYAACSLLSLSNLDSTLESIDMAVVGVAHTVIHTPQNLTLPRVLLPTLPTTLPAAEPQHQ